MSSCDTVIKAEDTEKVHQETALKEEDSSTLTKLVPSIEYHRTLYLDKSGMTSATPTPTSIHDVVSVVEGSLADVLPLLVYRLEDVFMFLSPDGVLRCSPEIRELLKSRPKMVFGSLMVAHGGFLYGVIIKEGVAKVVGVVRQLFSSLLVEEGDEGQVLQQKKDEAELCLVVKDDTKTGSPLSISQLVRLNSVSFDVNRQVLVTVPLGGYCFVQISGGLDEETDMSPLVLLVGVSFLLFDGCTLKWALNESDTGKSSKARIYYEANKGKMISSGSMLFQVSGGWVQEKLTEEDDKDFENGAHYVMNGFGLRPCHFNEAYYYALMHTNQTVKDSSIEEEQEMKKANDEEEKV